MALLFPWYTFQKNSKLSRFFMHDNRPLADAYAQTYFMLKWTEWFKLARLPWSDCSVEMDKDASGKLAIDFLIVN